MVGPTFFLGRISLALLPFLCIGMLIVFCGIYMSGNFMPRFRFAYRTRFARLLSLKKE
jgi:hypothetical protein